MEVGLDGFESEGEEERIRAWKARTQERGVRVL